MLTFLLRIVLTIMVMYYLPPTVFVFGFAIVGLVGLSVCSYYEGYFEAFDDMAKMRVEVKKNERS